MMQLYNDPEFLEKLGSKMGDVQLPNPAAAGAAGGSAAPPAAASPSAAVVPEVDNLLDAARCGGDGSCAGVDASRAAAARQPAQPAGCYGAEPRAASEGPGFLQRHGQRQMVVSGRCAGPRPQVWR